MKWVSCLRLKLHLQEHLSFASQDCTLVTCLVLWWKDVKIRKIFATLLAEIFQENFYLFVLCFVLISRVQFETTLSIRFYDTLNLLNNILKKGTEREWGRERDDLIFLKAMLRFNNFYEEHLKLWGWHIRMASGKM